MRPHVELIDDKDLIWHVAEFVHATGSARQKFSQPQGAL
jgi:hypothetical protein